MKPLLSSHILKFSGLISICTLVINMSAVPAIAADKNSELQSEIAKREISIEDANRAMSSIFPYSDFPYYEPVNGCSNPIIGFEEANRLFEKDCNNHDRCYQTIGKKKFYCDKALWEDILRTCNLRKDPCPIKAEIYYYGVDTKFQIPFVDNAQEAYDKSQKMQSEYVRLANDWLNFMASGIWRSTEGTINFQRSGSNVLARYSQDNGFIEGQISGNVLTGYWSENWSLSRCSTPRNGRYYWGKIQFVFDKPDVFRGVWNYCDREPKKTWFGSLKRS